MENNRKARRDQEKKGQNKMSFEKGGKKKVRKERQMKQNKGRVNQELQKGKKECLEKRKKRRTTLS